ncbi:hypothetical protein C7212DRAFT_343991 [Tuber magnatum]|uniref:Uncharacterized protein n=1 Tax=Tuber magnatum TaxID=42249 RepID=A0A317SQA4_9PEZI|nr:hypothetical protein C7212DRAFT_343991 [Tuber magnatum]
MRTREEILLPRALPGSAGGLPPLTGPDYLQMDEYNRPLTATFFALGIILCTVLVLSLIICCAARLAGRTHERRRVRMRERQRLTSGGRGMMRGLEVLRKGEGQGQETGVMIGMTVVVAGEEEEEEEEEGRGGKKDNVGDSDGCDGENGSGRDLEKGEGEEELPEYGAIGFNEKGEMIDAPCPAYLPRVKPTTDVANEVYGGMLVKEAPEKKVLWKWWERRRRR